MSRLDLVVGPNGAGKSTFVELVLADVRPGTTFVNADVIAAQRWARLWDNVADMVELAASAEVFDNSGPGPTTVAIFVAGEVVGAPRWPDWMPEALTRRWPVGPPA